jgi:hypothetical protein
MSAGEALAFARGVVERAWVDLPAADRGLLEAIRADGWDVIARPLGTYADDLLRSVGSPGLTPADRLRRDGALGLWVPELRVILINATHPDCSRMDDRTREYALARIAWHEWGHALGIVRATSDDVAAGSRLLDLLPAGLAETIRAAGYLRREYTHEIAAETYAMLMIRRRQGVTGRPAWLPEEVYELVRRVVGWNQ